MSTTPAQQPPTGSLPFRKAWGLYQLEQPLWHSQICNYNQWSAHLESVYNQFARLDPETASYLERVGCLIGQQFLDLDTYHRQLLHYTSPHPVLDLSRNPAALTELLRDAGIKTTAESESDFNLSPEYGFCLIFQCAGDKASWWQKINPELPYQPQLLGMHCPQLSSHPLLNSKTIILFQKNQKINPLEMESIIRHFLDDVYMMSWEINELPQRLPTKMVLEMAQAVANQGPVSNQDLAAVLYNFSSDDLMLLPRNWQAEVSDLGQLFAQLAQQTHQLPATMVLGDPRFLPLLATTASSLTEVRQTLSELLRVLRIKD